jgi:hypothetical protein
VSGDHQSPTTDHVGVFLSTKYRGIRGGAWLIIGATVAAVVLAVVANLTQPGPQNWYANGKAWAAADSKIDTARLIGPADLVTTWCTDNINSGRSSSEGVSLPYNAPSLSDEVAVNSWVRGCVAGYWADHPDQQIIDGELQ